MARPRPVPSGACRHIGLRQPVQMLRRQPDAVVGNAIGEVGTIRLQRDGDAAGLSVAPGMAGGDALARILEDIGQETWEIRRPSPSK